MRWGCCHWLSARKAAQRGTFDSLQHTAIVPDAACPAKVQSEVASVLPSADISKLLIVPTCQRAVMDLVQTGEQVEHEKDKLLEQVGLSATPEAPHSDCN